MGAALGIVLDVYGEGGLAPNRHSPFDVGGRRKNPEYIGAGFLFGVTSGGLSVEFGLVDPGELGSWKHIGIGPQSGSWEDGWDVAQLSKTGCCGPRGVPGGNLGFINVVIVTEEVGIIAKQVVAPIVERARGRRSRGGRCRKAVEEAEIVARMGQRFGNDDL